jgi:hypothetical protein
MKVLLALGLRDFVVADDASVRRVGAAQMLRLGFVRLWFESGRWKFGLLTGLGLGRIVELE